MAGEGSTGAPVWSIPRGPHGSHGMAPCGYWTAPMLDILWRSASVSAFTASQSVPSNAARSASGGFSGRLFLARLGLGGDADRMGKE